MDIIYHRFTELLQLIFRRWSVQAEASMETIIGC